MLYIVLHRLWAFKGFLAVKNGVTPDHNSQESTFAWLWIRSVAILPGRMGYTQLICWLTQAERTLQSAEEQ